MHELWSDARMSRIATRFWSSVDRSSHPRGCWIWTGAVDAIGYAKFSGYPFTTMAQRVAWELIRGEIPTTGLLVRRNCDDLRCVNPDHRYLSTRLDLNKTLGNKIHESVRAKRVVAAAAAAERAENDWIRSRVSDDLE